MIRPPARLALLLSLTGLAVLFLAAGAPSRASQTRLPSAAGGWAQAAGQMPRDLAPVALAAVQADAGPTYAATLASADGGSWHASASSGLDVAFDGNGVTL